MPFEQLPKSVKPRAISYLIRTSVIIVIAAMLAGCDDIPASVQHDVVHRGAKSELQVTITSREPYIIAQRLPPLDDSGWVLECRQAPRCEMPGLYRLKIYKAGHDLPIMDRAVEATFYSTSSGGDTNDQVVLGAYFYMGDLDPGEYRILIENLEDTPQFGKERGLFFIEYVRKYLF